MDDYAISESKQSKKAHSLRQLAYVLFDKMKHNT